jgi:DNA modification methylase
MKEPVQSDKGNGKSFRGGGSYTGGNAFNNHQLKDRETHGNAPNESGTRNRRSVWTIATRPYKGAHFATFPPALIEPCILAGSRPGDIVLDPFMGSGTTAAVSLQHGRRFLGCELNEDYAALQEERIRAVARL